MNKKSDILKSLEENLPPELVVARVIPETPTPPKERLISDSEEDYKFSREKLKSLLNKAEDSLDRLIVVADETEHPRSFEVLAGMLKVTSEMTGQLMGLSKTRKDLISSSNQIAPVAPNNVAVFVGTTADLQKQLSAAAKNTTIVATHDYAENPRSE